MTEAQRSIWFGVAFVIVIALGGVTLWKVAQPDKEVVKQLTALNGKLAATDAALAKVRSSTAAGIDAKLAQIDAKVDKTNATLAELRKGEVLKVVSAKLDELNAGIKHTETALANVTKMIPQGSLDSRVDAIGTEVKGITATLAEIKKAIPPAQNPQLAALSDQIKGLNDAVTALRTASANTSADKTAALTAAIADLKKNIDAASAAGGQFAAQAAKLNEQAAKLGEQAAKLEQATKTAAKPKGADFVVIYLRVPNETQLPKTVATVTPLTVQFQRIGSTNDEGQAKVIIAKLKDIIKGRKECTISVVGYADTLGSDDVNLEISKKRAAEIAAQLKKAFAGTGVQINQSAWGERRLKDWTPDRTPNLANRRVDITVACKG